MDRWLSSALDYIQLWLEFQMQASQQPGCIVAIAHRDKIVLERVWGSANLDTSEKLTPRHRFRIASHTKSFTAAGILRLREQGKLKLDDTAGQFVSGLNPGIARATIAQLLSHGAGLMRDGHDAGYFVDRRPTLGSGRSRADGRQGPLGGARIHQSHDRRRRDLGQRRNHGKITLGDGYGSYGEPVRCVRSKSGGITEFWSSATRFLPAAKVAREMERRYGSGKRRRRRGGEGRLHGVV